MIPSYCDLSPAVAFATVFEHVLHPSVTSPLAPQKQELGLNYPYVAVPGTVLILINTAEF